MNDTLGRMPTPEQVQAAIRSYVDSFGNNDKDAFVAAFATDAVQIDPYPSPANVGHEAIAGFWDNAHTMAETFEFLVKDTIVCGDRAAVPFTMTMGTAGGKMQFDGVDIFTINDDGKIAEINAYWDMAKIRPA